MTGGTIVCSIGDSLNRAESLPHGLGLSPHWPMCSEFAATGFQIEIGRICSPPCTMPTFGRLKMQNQGQAAAHWSGVQLLAFRFAFVYLALYYLPFPFGALPYTNFLAEKYQSLWLKLVPWVGKHILHLRYEILTSTNCSGDTTYDYVRVLCLLGLASLSS